MICRQMTGYHFNIITMKECITCKRLLEMESFYIHEKMADGHLNKCKDCIKESTRKRHRMNMNNPEYIQKQRKRGRDKYRRLNYISRGSRSNNLPPRYRNLNRFLKLRGLDMEEKEFHHWNYNLLDEGVILSRRNHSLIHNYLEFVQELNIFSYKGNILDTEDKHIKAIKDIMKINKVDSFLILKVSISGKKVICEI